MVMAKREMRMHVEQETREEKPTCVPMLPLARYRLRFKASEQARLPAYVGSAWRGALGHALKKVVCVTHLDTCPPCLLYRSCPYPYIFETPPPLATRKMRKYMAAPHPFLLEPPSSTENNLHHLGLTLIGRGNVHLPHIIYALQRAGEQGLGRGRASMVLMDVSQSEPAEGDTWVPIYQPNGELKPTPPSVPNVPATLQLSGWPGSFVGRSFSFPGRET
jgi:hypothetical protein